MGDTKAKNPVGGSFPRAWTAFRVRGIPVRIDVSWLVIAGLVVFVFFTRFTQLLADHGTAVVVGAAAAATALFFASLLAHELGHALASLNRDIPVLGITLFMLGGVTESSAEAKSARDEFVIVGVGPFISLVLGALFGLAYTAVEPAQPAAAVLGYLAWTNVLLAVFNLIPGYPLDGGRLLRSILWGATGQPYRSTRWAARVGQVFAASLIALGVWAFLSAGGTAFRGVWEVLIGFFLYRGAADSHRRARVREQLAGLAVRDVMGSIPPSLPAWLTLDEAMLRVQERPSLPWPVGDPLSGLLQMDDIDHVPDTAWAATRVGDVARPPDGRTIGVDETMDVALDRLAAASGHTLVVVDGQRAVGLLTASLVTSRL
jgi:Zn-dependent protease